MYVYDKYSKLLLKRKLLLSDNVVYKSLETGRTNICCQTPKKAKHSRIGKGRQPKLRFAAHCPYFAAVHTRS